jgi:hypothetical protein
VPSYVAAALDTILSPLQRSGTAATFVANLAFLPTLRDKVYVRACRLKKAPFRTDGVAVPPAIADCALSRDF